MTELIITIFLIKLVIIDFVIYTDIELTSNSNDVSME